MTAMEQWSAYLDAVESAAGPSSGRSRPAGFDPVALAAALPAALPRPDLPWPAALEDRRRQVLERLAVVTRRVERRRDGAAAALGRSGGPGRRLTTGYTDGAADLSTSPARPPTGESAERRAQPPRLGPARTADQGARTAQQRHGSGAPS